MPANSRWDLIRQRSEPHHCDVILEDLSSWSSCVSICWGLFLWYNSAALCCHLFCFTRDLCIVWAATV